MRSPLVVAGQVLQLGILGGIGYVSYRAAIRGSLGYEAQQAALQLYRFLHGGQDPPAGVIRDLWEKIGPGSW